MLGNRGHTTFANFMTILAFCTMGAAPTQMNMWLGLLMLLPTMERRAATSAMATDHAIAAGMGRGEYQAAFANFRALTVITAPILYGRMYSTFAPSGKGGYAFFAGAAIVAFAELCHRSLSDKDCEVPKSVHQ
jgi:hypothetical protein